MDHTETSAHKYLRWFFTLLLTALGIFLVVYAVPKLIAFFFPFVLAWIIALIAAPLIRLMQKKLHLTNKLGSAIVVVLFVALILGLLFLVMQLLINETVAFLPKAPGYISSVLDALDTVGSWLTRTVEKLPEGLIKTVDNLIEDLKDILVNWGTDVAGRIGSKLASYVSSIVLNLPRTFFYSIITIVASYLLIMEKDNILNALRRYLPRWAKDAALYAKKSFRRALGGYFVAELKMSWIVALIMLAGFILMKVPYAFLLSLLVAFVDFLPVFGSGTILLPWALVALLNHSYWMALELLVLYLLTQGFKQVVGPKLMGETMGLPPLLTVVFLFIGFKLYGIGGMIFAIPLGMILVEICQYGVFDAAVGVFKEMAAEVQAILKKPVEEKEEPEPAEDEFDMTEEEVTEDDLPQQKKKKHKKRSADRP